MASNLAVSSFIPYGESCICSRRLRSDTSLRSIFMSPSVSDRMTTLAMDVTKTWRRLDFMALRRDSFSFTRSTIWLTFVPCRTAMSCRSCSSPTSLSRCMGMGARRSSFSSRVISK